MYIYRIYIYFIYRYIFPLSKLNPLKTKLMPEIFSQIMLNEVLKNCKE